MRKRDLMPREERIEYDTKLTRHHIIARSKKELFNNVFDEQNIAILQRRKHELHHIAQGNNTPHETLVSYSFLTKVMSPIAKELYEELLFMERADFYDEKFVKQVRRNRR